MHIASCIPKATRTQTHTQNKQYLLVLHCNNSCANAPQYYVICQLPVFKKKNCTMADVQALGLCKCSMQTFEDAMHDCVGAAGSQRVKT